MFFKGFAKTAKNVDFDCKIFKDRGNVWFFSVNAHLEWRD